MGAVGTVSVSPSYSPPNFPLGSPETEVKVAAGTFRAGQIESRWDEQNATNARSGVPAIAADGLMVRPEEELPMEMRVWGKDEHGPLAKRKQADRKEKKKSQKPEGR